MSRSYGLTEEQLEPHIYGVLSNWGRPMPSRFIEATLVLQDEVEVCTYMIHRTLERMQRSGKALVFEKDFERLYAHPSLACPEGYVRVEWRDCDP